MSGNTLNCYVEALNAQAAERGAPVKDRYGAEYPASAWHSIPKAVAIAVAVSSLTCGGDHLEAGLSRFMEEWAILHANGIVPQRPPGALMAAVRQSDLEGES